MYRVVETIIHISDVALESQALHSGDRCLYARRKKIFRIIHTDLHLYSLCTL